MPRITRSGFWYVLVKINGEWYYLADRKYSNLDHTQYIALAWLFYSKKEAELMRNNKKASGIDAKITRGY